jgi:phosphopantothenoylcysteine decarboxylase/phosphopantothenate--cysteine ligase
MADRVLVGVTGSIAAYKAAELVRLLKKEGREVRVVMTRAATRFVGELTFRTLSQNPVGVDLFEDPPEWEPQHVSLADWAEVFVIAPCTANVMAKLAAGLADDLLTGTALAFAGPLVVAPAMNERMWEHPATRQNAETLRARGVTLVDVGTGDLACGWRGKGRMAEPEEILAAVKAACGKEKP